MNKKLLGIYGAGIGLVALIVTISAQGGAGPSLNSEEVLGGGNLPDRCDMFTQASSRSLKDSVKTSGGKVFLVRVTNAGATEMFFQLFNRTTVPKAVSVPVLSAPIGGTTASRSPAVYVERFEPALDFTSGIAFALSDSFASYSSLSAGGIPLDRDNLTVSLCYQ